MTTPKTITGHLNRSQTGPQPTIECHVPSSGGKYPGLIIFPGGGYNFHAPHEGTGYAEYFVQHGYACFVVYYRVGSKGHRHPAMLEDGMAAVETIRGRAGELKVDPDRIGVMGSSAGGHLAAHVLTSWQHYSHALSLRPDYGILCYPVITMTDPHCHKGSRSSLLGENPTGKLITSVSCEKLVSSDTPPCFIWHTWEDDGVAVENSLLFASSLRANRVPFDLHIYAKGSHGLGLRAEFPWAHECLRWLRAVD